MSTFATITLLAVLTTIGLVGAAVSDGVPALTWAIGTVVAAGLLAWRLRSAPPGGAFVAAFVTGITVVSAGLPATILISEGTGTSAGVASRGSKSGIDPSTELRAILAKADELFPGGTNAILRIQITEHWTQIRMLDLTRGQSVSFQYSQGSGWNEPSRSPSNDRADAVFKAADIAGLDPTAAQKKVFAAADRLGVNRSSPFPSNGIDIGRRSADKRLVATYEIATSMKFETDPSGNLPDNLTLAKVDGLLPIAERLLRANGIDPTKPVIDEIGYRSFGSNTSSVGARDPGTVEIDVSGPTSGTLTETVGRFPEARMYGGSPSPSSYAFALAVITPAGIEKARADVQQRFAVPAIDTSAISLELDRDTTSPGWTRGKLPPLMRLGLGPDSSTSAYYRPDGTFVSAKP